MKSFIKLALAAVVVIMASLGASAQSELTYEQAVSLVKAQRTDSANAVANYYATTVTELINDGRCQLNETPTETWATNGSDMILVYADDQPWLDRNYRCTYYYMPKEVTSLSDVPVLSFAGGHYPTGLSMQKVDVRISGNCHAVMNPFINMREQLPNLRQGVFLDTINTKVILTAFYGDTDERSTRQWNTCSALYKLLLQRFGIPKSDIRIFINDLPDGPYRATMIGPDNTIIFVPRDYDGDGIDEDVYFSLDSVYLATIADSKQKAIDHLFLYDCFGGFYSTGMGTQYPTDLFGLQNWQAEDYLHEIDAGILNVMTDGWWIDTRYGCKSLGDYVSTQYWKEPPVITGEPSRSDETELDASYNPFMFAWLGALNGSNLLTNEVIASDLNEDGHVSMWEAYQCAKDSTNLDRRIVASEDTLARILSFDQAPRPARLLVRRFESDTLGTASIAPVVTWNSPDIWLRDTDDGVTYQEQGCVKVNSDDTEKYIYVRMKNTGKLPYVTQNKYLHIFWELGNLSSFRAPDDWIQPSLYGYLQPVNLTQTIAPDTCLVVEIPLQLTSDMINLADDYNGILPINIYAKIDNNPGCIEPDHTQPRKSLIRFNADDGVPFIIQTNPLRIKHMVRTTIPVYLASIDGSIGMLAQDSTTNNTYGSMYVQFPENMDITGLTPVNAVYQGDNKFLMSGSNANILGFNEEDIEDNMLFYYEKEASHLPMNDISQIWHIVVRDQSGSIVDGTAVQFDIYGTGFGPGGPIIGVGDGGNGTTELTALNTSPGSTYEWYSDAGELIGTNATETIEARDAHGNVLLRVQEQEDGRVGYASVNLDEVVFISSVNSLPGCGIEIFFSRPVPANASISVTSIFSAEAVASVTVPTESSSATLQIPGGGLYVVSLLVNGELVDVRQIEMK